MDRETALEILESLGPDVDPLAWASGAERASENGSTTVEVHEAEQRIAAAAGLLAVDPVLADEFSRRQQWDRQLVRTMHDVSVPAGLKQQLLDSLAAAGEGASAVSAASTEGAASTVVPESVASRSAARSSTSKAVPPSRRLWLRTGAATMAGLLLIAVSWWLGQSRPPQITVAQLQQLTLNDLTGRPAFEGDWQPLLPAGWEYSELLQPQAPQSVLLPSTETSIAGYQFQVASRRMDAVQGVLLVVPVSSLADPPESRSIEGPVNYLTSGESMYTAVSWREGNLAYVCLVAGGDDSMRLVRRAVRGEPA